MFPLKAEFANLFSLTGDIMIKGCAELPGGTPEQVCNSIRKKCGDDPKFHCRYCQTDKCNTDE
jgi:hypothetical protein